MTSFRCLAPTTVFCALVLSASSGSLAQTATASPQPKPTSVSTVGTLRVERYGSGSPAMIFIPGLACGSWVWAGALSHYAGTHAVYLVTLAGFDGVPASSGPAIPLADASLLALISKDKLDRPILIGHRLGGHLALRFGEEHPALVRGIVSVDGTPVFPGLALASPDERIAAAEKYSAQLAAASPTEYAESNRQLIGAMVTDPGKADNVAALSARSDRKATLEDFKELLSANIRPKLPAITIPTLELVPVPTQPQPFEGPQGRECIDERSRGELQANLCLETVSNSRHFIMIDQPDALFADVDEFLGTFAS